MRKVNSQRELSVWLYLGPQLALTHVVLDVLVGETKASLLIAPRKHGLHKVALLRRVQSVVLEDFEGQKGVSRQLQAGRIYPG